jgi:hypothetical protein
MFYFLLSASSFFLFFKLGDHNLKPFLAGFDFSLMSLTFFGALCLSVIVSIE